MAVKPAKRPRVSKNKKKNWRKHSNVDDVEEHLETIRFEERTGGPVAEKPNEELFVVDVAKRKKGKVAKKKKKVTDKPLQCFKHLEPAKWPQPCTKPSSSKAFGEKQRSQLLKKQMTKKIKALRQSSNEEQAPNTNIIPTSNYDLWEDHAEATVDCSYRRDIVEFYETQTRKKRIKAPKLSDPKTSVLAAIESPHPGASYNPAYDDYQNLVHSAHRVELQKKKEEDHLERVLTNMFPKKSDAPTEMTWLQEMAEGLPYEGEPAEDETNEMLPEGNTLPNPATRGERKLASKKRREMRQKQLEKNLAVSKKLRKQQNEIFRLKSIKSELKAAEATTAKRVLKRQREADLKRLKPATLGQHKYEAPDLEVCTAEELSASLRNLKPQGHVAEDRLKSFQRRNVIEPRILQLRKRKYKLKRYTRKGHRIEDLP